MTPRSRHRDEPPTRTQVRSAQINARQSDTPSHSCPPAMASAKGDPNHAAGAALADLGLGGVVSRPVQGRATAPALHDLDQNRSRSRKNRSPTSVGPR